MVACGRICRRARSARRSRSCKRENFELRRANEILKAAVGVFRDRARRRPTEVTAFIDEHRDRFGVEPICRVLDVSASAYYHRATRRALQPASSRTSGCSSGSGRCTRANYEAYGYRRMWKALLRAGEHGRRAVRCSG